MVISRGSYWPVVPRLMTEMQGSTLRKSASPGQLKLAFGQPDLHSYLLDGLLKFDSLGLHILLTGQVKLSFGQTECAFHLSGRLGFFKS